MTATVIVDDIELDIPSWVKDLNSFREWVDDPDFPEKVPVWWLRGKVWADMSREQLFSHNVVRTAITSVLWQLLVEKENGVIWSDGAYVSNPDADIAGKPDMIFASHESLAEGRVALAEGRERGFVEIVGAPDMVLEVVSKSSVTKDKRDLFEAYWLAGISEYWLVDARQTPAVLGIWKHSANGYVAGKKSAGWIKSKVFDQSFRLIEKTDRSKLPTYRLEVR
jgi:Uma2 family endonuclease